MNQYLHKEALNKSIGSAELAERPGCIRARKVNMRYFFTLLQNQWLACPLARRAGRHAISGSIRDCIINYSLAWQAFILCLQAYKFSTGENRLSSVLIQRIWQRDAFSPGLSISRVFGMSFSNMILFRFIRPFLRTL